MEPMRRRGFGPRPLCLAHIAVEAMCEAKHLFPQSKHIFICPALCTGYWQKTLSKLADTTFSFPAGSSIWPDEMFEPLTVAFVQPLLSHSPWQVRRLQRLVKWESKLSNLRRACKKDVRDHMREFWR